MGKNDSLLTIMNDVSGHLDMVLDRAPAVMGEMDAFIALDPFLASLNKQYLDAKSNRVNAEKEFGACDGMTDMAVILEDSAWCAMQTRYMEVRKDRMLMAQAQKLMADSCREEEAEEKREKEKYALKMWNQMQLYTRMREQAQKDNSYIWFVAMFLMAQRNISFMPSYTAQHFNRLAA